MKASIVIRAMNEAGPLERLLASLATQQGIDRKDFEVIVVDNESTDGTAEVAKRYGARVVNLPRGEFTFPRSMNLGVGAAQAPIVVLTVGHAWPVGPNWLASALKHFTDPKVAGVYAPVKPVKGCGLGEWLLFWPGYASARLFNPYKVRKVHGPELGATNAAIRRDLWQERPFDERYELGGEDSDWAKWVFSKGYDIIREVGFAVYHTHGLSLWGALQQKLYWMRLKHPTHFSREALEYRNDIKW